MAIYLKDNGIWKGMGDAWTPTLSFDSNGGSGTMSTYSGFGTMTIPSNTFSKSGAKFIGWNTAANGSGTSYSVGQQVDVRNDITLYAQWQSQYTVTYYKIYNHDYPSFYPPSSNSGPVSKNGSNYYLKCTINGVDIPGLGDNFTVSDKYSPTRTMTVDAGASLYIQLINKNDGDLCEVYLNGTRVHDPAEYVYYTYPGGIQSNMTITFTWESQGTVFSNPQSYWVCHITTS